MKILKTPWKKDFLELVTNTRSSIKITSPFIKEGICDEMLVKTNDSVKIDLITSFKLPNIHSGSLDIEALQKIINHNGTVNSLSKLHSKIYLFDNKEVIISSGNMTNGGMLNNFEYGIYSNDKSLVSKVVDDFESIMSDEKTSQINSEHLIKVKEILAKIPKAETIKFPKFEIETSEDDVIEIPFEQITSSLNGWKLEVFKCISQIPSSIFNLNDVNKFEPQLKIIYPSNQHISDKIRQQLQYLRNLGLIEFLGNGNYRKLWK